MMESLLLDHKKKSIIIFWLIVCILLIIFMILLGGATRLTESGLSIVEWRPITGILPPLTHNDWMKEFAHYQTFPEYQFKHMDLTLEGFKFIFYMEYSHRLLGRVLGLVFFIPLCFFWKNFSRPLRQQSLILLFFGCLQGFMGWFMVKSGLVNNPYVSHYRLAAHLLLAFILLAFFMKTLLRILPQPQIFAPPSLKKCLYSVLILITLTLFYGALVAGLRAGKLYNTFPTMGGDWIPMELFFERPLWINFFENPTTVQWMHRVLATLTFFMSSLASILLWKHHYKSESFLLFSFIALQFTLGALTVIHIVPIPLALMHQGGGHSFVSLCFLFKDTDTTARLLTPVIIMSFYKKSFCTVLAIFWHRVSQSVKPFSSTYSLRCAIFSGNKLSVPKGFFPKTS